MSKSKDGQCSSAILEYLNKQNRPYSATDVQNNLHNEFGKTAVTKALDQLVTEGKLKSKNYNKQVVYVADQSQFQDVNDSELKAMDDNIRKLTENLKVFSDESKALETKLCQLNAELTTEEAENHLKLLSQECENLKERLTSLKSNSNTISPKEKALIVNHHANFCKEWKKRKRMCNEMINAVLENYPKSKKALLEETGVETDEDLSITMPKTC